MSKLPLYSSHDVVRALERDGFESGKKSKGSHQAFKKPKSGGGTHVVIVPIGKKEIPRGTFKSILKQANLTEDEFLELV